MESVTQQVQQLFDEWARAGRGSRMEKGHWPTSSQILNRLDLKPGQLFLDIGCGNGYCVAWAADRVAPGGKAIGLDLSPDMIAEAKTHHSKPSVEFIIGQAETLPFETATFDSIINIESLYYYRDIPQVLSEIHRALKPGGQFAAMVDFYKENPYSAVWQDLMPIPMTYLSETDYQKAFQAAGLVDVRTERLFNPEPVDISTFQPGWGYDTVEDVIRFRQTIGSLAIWGRKPVPEAPHKNTP